MLFKLSNLNSNLVLTLTQLRTTRPRNFIEIPLNSLFISSRMTRSQILHIKLIIIIIIKSNKRQQPKWKARRENQIKSIRTDLSILTDMAQRGETQRSPRKSKELKRKTK